MMDVTSDLPRAVTGAPKDIRAGWTNDCRAGVLSNHQMAKADAPLLAGERQVGLDEEWRAVYV
jgi:hypothetical protein